MTIPTPTRPRLEALTGLRWLLAVHVVAYHFTGRLGWGPPEVRAFVSSGIAQVGCFFVLSGFVLTYGAADAAPDRPTFWARRFARIYPVYLCATVMAAPFVWWSLHDRFGGGAPFRMAWIGVLTLLLLQAWYPPASAAWNTPGWSLSAEAFFYASFPFVLPLVRRLDVRRLLASVVALIGLALVPPLVFVAADLSSGLARDVVLQWPLLRWPDFLVGCCLGRLMVLVRPGPVAARPIVATIVTASALLAVGLRAPLVLVSNGVLLPAFVWLVWSLARGPGRLTRVLGSAPIVLLGEASYGIYILQFPVRAVWERVLDDWNPATFLAYLVSLHLVALVALVAVERPGRRWLQARLSPRSDPGS